MANNKQEITSTVSDRKDAQCEDWETCRKDWDLLYQRGFKECIKSPGSFLKKEDILRWRYPLHYIKRNEEVILDKIWYVKWDYVAYKMHNIKSKADKLNIPSGIKSEWERTEKDYLIVKTPPMNIYEAIRFYDLLNESRFSN